VSQPSYPVYPKPVIDPIYPKPVIDPVYPKPVIDPVYPKPVNPFNPRPVDPVYPKPVDPVYPKPVDALHPKPIHGNSVFGNRFDGVFDGSAGLFGMDNGINQMELQQLMGSSVAGRPLQWGETINGIVLPEHGGTLNPDGIQNGFGAVDPLGARPSDGWNHPWNNMPYPRDFTGQNLVFDSQQGRYVYEHQLQKAEHNVHKAVGGAASPIGHGSLLPHGGARHGQVLPRQDVVHDVNKVSSGVAAAVASDPASADLGRFIAGQAIGNAADIVNFGSGGAQAAGDIFANDATARLAMEGLHIGKKSVALASGVAPVKPQAQPVFPVFPKQPSAFPTGYRGRQRRHRRDD